MAPIKAFMPQTCVLVQWHLRLLQAGFRQPEYSQYSQITRALATRANPYDDPSNSTELEEARVWFARFDKNSIPRKIGKTDFSRSSGPGGQKVNKTSSKATTVWPMSSLRLYVPKILVPELRSSSYYVASSDSISIQCDTHRDQSSNMEETHARLYEEVQRIFKHRVPGETSAEQRKKVEELQKLENTARLKMKKMHGDKKKARRSGRGGDD